MHLGVRDRGQDDGGDEVGKEWVLHWARVPTHLDQKGDQGGLHSLTYGGLVTRQ